MLFAVVLAALLQPPPNPITIPDGPLTASWTSSTLNGSGRMTQTEPDFWQWGPATEAGDYLGLTYSQGSPFLVLNTAGGVVPTGQQQSPRAILPCPGFVLANATQSPFSLTFTVATAPGTGWGSNISIVITQP